MQKEQQTFEEIEEMLISEEPMPKFFIFNDYAEFYTYKGVEYAKKWIEESTEELKKIEEKVKGGI